MGLRFPVQKSPISHRKRSLYTSPVSLTAKEPYQQVLCLWSPRNKKPDLSLQKSPINEVLYLSLQKSPINVNEPYTSHYERAL